MSEKPENRSDVLARLAEARESQRKALAHAIEARRAEEYFRGEFTTEVGAHGVKLISLRVGEHAFFVPASRLAAVAEFAADVAAAWEALARVPPDLGDGE